MIEETDTNTKCRYRDVNHKEMSEVANTLNSKANTKFRHGDVTHKLNKLMK